MSRGFFEQLLINPKDLVKDICEFLDIVFYEEMLKDRRLRIKADNDNSWTSDYEKQVSAEISQNSLYKWKNELQPFEISYIEKYCFEEMEFLGYEKILQEKYSFHDRLRNDINYLRQFIENQKRRFTTYFGQENE